MKLAYFSPFNPQKSGISDYSEELLPHLARRATVDLFVEGFEPSSPEVRGRFRLFDFRRDPSCLKRLSGYDAAVYHVGNDHRYHTGIVEVARAHAGFVVLHDFALQDFYWGLARERGDPDIYLDELAACHGGRERDRAAESLRGGGTPPHLALPLAYPLNCRLARAAEAVIVHSEWARARVQEIAPAAAVAKINMPVKPPGPGPQASGGRAESGAGRGRVEVATFGLITPGKGIEQTLRALAALRHAYDFHYTLVGEPSAFYDVEGLIRAHGMRDRVTVTGHVTLAEFERRISETDIAVNLRERTVGETSASLCRIMAAGVPAIVADAGWYSELPDGAVVKVDLDESCDALLRAYLRRLMEDARLRSLVGERASRFIRQEHDIVRSAEAYVEFIGEVVAGRARRRFVGGVAAEMARMGLREEDEEVLRGVAAEIAALAPSSAFEADGGQNGDRPMMRESLAEMKTPDSPVAAPPVAASPAATSPAALHASEVAETSVDVPAARGRLPKIEGIDYKRAAREYPRKLDAERAHYLKTKPFYNLANKPPKHKGDGMDAETHRHFCDFANLASALALPAGARILDVGCGSGWLSEYFARLGYDVTGIDISDDLINTARERAARVPFDVDHQTPLRCRFLTHDIETAPLAEQFDAVVCYDSLHHFEDERAVVRHLAAMLPVGGVLFVLEGDKPPEGSATEEELTEVMRQYETLESPFSREYLRALLDEHGFAITGDFLSVNGLFERELLEGGRLAVEPPDSNYLLCKKVAEGAPASSVPDSLRPGLLRARLVPLTAPPATVGPGQPFAVPLSIENAGDTLWLTGQTVRTGVVMPAVRVYDGQGDLIAEFHGQPLLPRAVAPGETVTLAVEYSAPRAPGAYTMKIDLVDQHVCWFEERGSAPLVLRFEVIRQNDEW